MPHEIISKLIEPVLYFRCCTEECLFLLLFIGKIPLLKVLKLYAEPERRMLQCLGNTCLDLKRHFFAGPAERGDLETKVVQHHTKGSVCCPECINCTDISRQSE